MSVLTRTALEGSPLADLHTIAGELGIDGFRRLRKADLVDAILQRQDGGDAEIGAAEAEPAAEAEAEPAAEAEAEAVAEEQEEARPRRTRSRGGRGRATRDADTDSDSDEEPAEAPARGRAAARRPAPRRDAEDRVVDGVVELLPNGSGFVRVSPPEPSDDDVYVSAAQVRRCELVGGDKVTGPVRAPRRSERYPSLVRVDTINGTPADEVAEGTHYDDLPAAFPSERFALGGDDPTLKAIEWLTPIGRGSRVTIVGGPRAGKSEVLRRLAAALNGQDGLELTLVLAGVRPEEAGEAKAGPVPPAVALTFAAGADSQGQAVERAVDTARRVTARGGDAVVLIDSLDGLHAPAARKVLAAARNIDGGGSLTVIATSTKPLGGETTVIALDANLTSTGRFPALDLVASGSLRPELLVGEAGAEAIAQARAEALG
jgi:transcription termination factor Rho